MRVCNLSLNVIDTSNINIKLLTNIEISMLVKIFLYFFYNYHHNKMLLAIKYFENLFSESMCLKVFLNSLGK